MPETQRPIAASSKCTKIPSPNCSMAGSQSASREMGAPLNVLKLSVCGCWGGVETREAIKTGDFAQPMHRDNVLYCREIDLGPRVGPHRSSKRLRVELCTWMVLANLRPTAGELLKLRQFWRLFGVTVGPLSDTY
jgi:hypothetical protein